MPAHETPIRVRYGETDQAGVVYYGNYLLYFEQGRSEHMRARGLPYSELERRGIFLTVADSYCKYLGTAAYDDLIVVRTRITKVSLTRVTFEYEIARDDTGDIICTGSTILACIDANRKPRRLPDDVKAALDVTP